MRPAGWHPERNHIDQPPQGWILGIAPGIDPIDHGKRSQPVVALPLTGTEEEVCLAKLVDHDTEVRLVDRLTAHHVEVVVHQQVLQQERVIEVHYQVGCLPADDRIVP